MEGELFVVEVWGIHNMCDDVLLEYDIFYTEEEAKRYCENRGLQVGKYDCWTGIKAEIERKTIKNIK